MAGRSRAGGIRAPEEWSAARHLIGSGKVTEILGASSARGQSHCFLGGCPQSEAAPGCRQTYGVGRGRGPRIVARRRVHRHRRRLRLQLSSVQTVRAPNPRDGNDDPRFCPNGRNAVGGSVTDPPIPPYLPSIHSEGERLRNIPQYTDFRALDRDLRDAASKATTRITQSHKSSKNEQRETSGRRWRCRRPRPDDVPFGMLVAITGAARSDTLVDCVHTKRPGGTTPERAIYVDAVTDQYLARQAIRTGEWIRDCVTVASVAGEAPTWRLEDTAGVSVNMHRASAIAQASDAARCGDWRLSLVHDRFESVGGDGGGTPLHSRIIANALDMNMGLNVLGLRHRERILAPGTELTAVGEVYLAPNNGPVGLDGSDGAGELRLRRPRRRDKGHKGRDKGNESDEDKGAVVPMDPAVFTVTQKPFSEYVDGFGAWGKVNAAAGLCFAVVGVLLCVRKVTRVRLMRWREARFLRRMKEAEEARVLRGDGGGVEGGVEGGEGLKLEPGETCVICMQSRSAVVYKECGHLVCCAVCAGRIDRCPICRRRSAHMKVYRAGL